MAKLNNTVGKIEVSVVIFCDKLGNVIVQKRGKKSRNNEKYALWGGMVKKRETGDEAIKRELTEELGFIPKILDKCGDYEFDIKEGKYKGEKILFHVYLSPIPEEWKDSPVHEGEKMVMLKTTEITNNPNFFQGDRDLFWQLINEGKIS